ncbi:unnamed protein product [Lota lota]
MAPTQLVEVCHCPTGVPAGEQASPSPTTTRKRTHRTAIRTVSMTSTVEGEDRNSGNRNIHLLLLVPLSGGHRGAPCVLFSLAHSHSRVCAPQVWNTQSSFLWPWFA